MRLFHSVSGSIHLVGIKFSMEFVASDFVFGASKSIVPTQVCVGDNVSSPSVFYCYDCGTVIEPSLILSKCFKCGELFPASSLLAHIKTGLVYCEDHSERYKEEKETTRPLLSHLSTVQVK